MRKNYLVVFLFLLTLTTFAQKGVVSGKILDAADKFPLPGAMVQIAGQNKYTISDGNGRYEFLNVAEGSYEIEIRYIGYSPVKNNVTVVAGKNTVVNFNLHTSGTELNEVVVGDVLKGQAKALSQQKHNKNISNVNSSFVHSFSTLSEP